MTAVMTLPEPISVSGMKPELFEKHAAFKDELERNLPQIMAVLPQGVRAQAMASATMTAALDNPKLLDCSPISLMRAVLKMATLGLRIGETCDLVPIGAKAECWVRVKGVVELAIRSGAIRWAREGFVCEGDEFEHEERGDGTHFRHKALTTPKLDGSNLTHVYAVLTLPNGGRVFEVWPIARVLEHKAKHAKDTGPGSVWAKHPLPMMAKTVVKAALRFAPLSPELRSAIAAGDDIPEGSFEVIANPETALSNAASALDALEQLGAGAAGPDTMTLADAEAMAIPGKTEAWGGHGGQRIGDLKTSLLGSVHQWIDKDPTRQTKFAAVKLAVGIVLDDRADRDATGELAEDA